MISRNCISAIIFSTTVAGVHSAEPNYTLLPRTDVDQYKIGSVVVMRSTVPGTRTAFDVVPNGNPAKYGNLGAAWIHVCNNDLPVGKLNCAVMTASDTSVRFGSNQFVGKDGVKIGAKPVEFLVGETVAATLTEKSLTVGDFNTKNILARIKRLEAICLDK